MLMDHFDELVTDRIIRLANAEAHLAGMTGDERFGGRYRVVSTSGTTGRRGIFLSDPIEWATVIASYNRAQEWAGIVASPLRRTRLAVVSTTTGWHQSARVGAGRRERSEPVRGHTADRRDRPACCHRGPIEPVPTGLPHRLRIDAAAPCRGAAGGAPADRAARDHECVRGPDQRDAPGSSPRRTVGRPSTSMPRQSRPGSPRSARRTRAFTFTRTSSSRRS